MGLDFRERTHDEQAVVRPRMGKREDFGLKPGSTVSDQVEIQRPRRVGLTPQTPEPSLDRGEFRQHLKRVQSRLDNNDAVDVVRSLWIWPSSRSPPP